MHMNLMIVKLSKMRRIVINVPIFNQNITVIVAKDVASITKWVNDSFNQNFSFDVKIDGSVYMAQGSIIVGLEEGVEDKVILHESLHVVFALDRILGLDYSEELWCYLLEFIYSAIKQFVND